MESLKLVVQAEALLHDLTGHQARLEAYLAQRREHLEDPNA